MLEERGSSRVVTGLPSSYLGKLPTRPRPPALISLLSLLARWAPLPRDSQARFLWLKIIALWLKAID
jgi:hypothetical protein